MLKADMEMGKAFARIIAKEEIAAVGAKSESKIKDLETKVVELADMLAKDIKELEVKIDKHADMFVGAVKDLEAKIESSKATLEKVKKGR